MYEDLVIELRAIESYGSTEISSYDAGLYADAIEGMNEIINDLNETIKMYGKDAPCWVPVTEQPPLKVGDGGYNGYLVYANGYYEVADYTTDTLDNVPCFYVDGEYEPDVTHYMSLPQPPKEEIIS